MTTIFSTPNYSHVTHGGRVDKIATGIHPMLYDYADAGQPKSCQSSEATITLICYTTELKSLITEENQAYTSECNNTVLQDGCLLTVKALPCIGSSDTTAESRSSVTSSYCFV
jgi:hypothetical protein